MRVLVCLDSNPSHAHDHMLAEFQAYTALTSVGSYCCVFVTIVEDMAKEMLPRHPWSLCDNPKTRCVGMPQISF
jgi:cephalosporin hydroxylase